MKKLIRGDAPHCLAKFKHGKDNWSVIRDNGLGKAKYHAERVLCIL